MSAVGRGPGSHLGGRTHSKDERATGLVLVSHSALLAGGVVELAAQMAPDVVLRPAGGTDDARLGTSFDVVERAIAAELDAGCSGVVLLADIGSARMTAEAVIEITGSRSEIVYEPLPKDDPQVRQPDISLAKEVLGWEPKVDLREGLRRTIEHSGVEKLVGLPV